jgi:hypothetical protein
MSSGVVVAIATAIGISLVGAGYAALSKRRNERATPLTATPLEVPAGHGAVAVIRPHAGLGGAARSLTVVVDGKESGRVKAGATVEVPLPAGRHTVLVGIGRLKSDVREVDVVSGERSVLEAEIVQTAFSGCLELRPAAA